MAEITEIHPADIVKVIKSTTVMTRWGQICDELGLNAENKIEVRDRQLLAKLGSTTMVEVLTLMLEKYCDQFGNQATVGNLKTCLRSLDLNAAVDLLSDSFEGMLGDNAIITSSAPIIKKLTVSQTPTTVNEESIKLHDFINDSTPLTVRVIPAKKHLGTKGKHNYSLRSKPYKGYALIINNMRFQNPEHNRIEGGQLDGAYVLSLFEGLGFKCSYNVDIGDILKLTEVITAFKKTFPLKKVDGKEKVDFDCCVVIIMSHGQHDRIDLCDNGESANFWTSIVYQFDHNQSPELSGTPKIFITEACQNFKSSYQTDAMQNFNSSAIEDAIVCFPSLPGFYAQRDEHKGSWFIYILVKVMMQLSCQKSFIEMLQIVQQVEMDKISNAENTKQTPIWTPLKFNELYFNPGI